MNEQMLQLDQLRKVILKAEKVSLIWELMAQVLEIDIKDSQGINLVVKECKKAYDEREKAIEAIDRMMKDSQNLDRLEVEQNKDSHGDPTPNMIDT